MNEIETNEVQQLPDKYRPLGAWAYFGYELLFSIPIVGIICLIMFSLNDSNINRRNFARSFFCFFVVIAVIVILIIAAGACSAAGRLN